MFVNTVVLNGARAPVTAATIFQSDTAEVTRTLSLELKNGRNVVKISDVSGVIHLDSPRISGAPNGVRIVDVVCNKKPGGEDPNPEIAAIMKKGKTLYAEREVRREQVGLLDGFKRLFSPDPRMWSTAPAGVRAVGGANISEFVDSYGQQKLALQSASQILDEEIAELEKELATLRAARKGETSAIITATLVAESDVKAELKLTYLVSGAMWRPFYDLHATTLDGQPSKDVSMRYCATIVQGTGEDWNDVALTLSTADAQAQRQLAIPVLRPLKVTAPNGRVTGNYGGGLPAASAPGTLPSTVVSDTATSRQPSDVAAREATARSASHETPSPFAPPKVVTVEDSPGSTVPAYRRAMMRMHRDQTMSAVSLDSESLPPVPQPAPTSAPPPQAPPGPATPLQPLTPSTFAQANSPSRSALSVAYRIDGAVTIPSDGEKHRLTIALLNFKTKLSYMCVPRQSPIVYILSKVENTSAYDLLPGTVNVYMNDRFVTRTSIDFISVNESFECVLGVDTSIKVSYRQDEKTEREPRRSFAEPQKTTTQTMVTTIINRHNHGIPELIIRESIPLGSEEDKVSVVLRKPVGLADAKDGQTILDRVETGDGESAMAKVRWTEVVDGKGGEKDGMFEWIHAIPAGKKVSFEVQWDVKSPGDVRLAE
ncbi:hypothetical protein FKP32DRAFT_1597260 [Trametes sanguinea]|nr:hypothetical protein FKP32DRAFT_1597260 [Trametes sanguinea]